MLRRLATIRDCTLAATDGEIGTARDVLFDDESWTVRYLLVKTGGWLRERDVLISPKSLGEVDPENQRIPTNLSQEQVRNSPEFDFSLPVTRAHESEFHRYFGWPVYWSGLVAGIGSMPLPMRPEREETVRAAAAAESRNEESGPERASRESRLRSAREVEGYHIHARDGDIGHVEEYLIDSSDWRVGFLVVATRNWWPGRKVVVPTTSFEHVDWLNRMVTTTLTRDQVRSAPEFSPAVFDEGYEETLRAYYGEIASHELNTP